jgi:hypothetical protein
MEDRSIKGCKGKEEEKKKCYKDGNEKKDKDTET